MSEKICYIVCAGENKGVNVKLKDGDLLIAADGGLDHLKRLSLLPSVIVGDFDSVTETPKAGEIIKLKKEKNETDTFVCAQEAIKRGYKIIYIYCGTGGRIDHTLANVQLLVYLAKRGVKAYLFDGEQVVTALFKNQELCFDETAKGIISVFSATDFCEGVSLIGLKYCLENGKLENDFALGVSNEFVGAKSKITAKKGVLLIVFPSDCIDNMI